MSDTQSTDDNSYEGIRLVPEPSKQRLNNRQLVDYRGHRKRCIRRLLTFGKDPSTADGYAHGTVDPRSSRMDRFYRWVWDAEGGYTLALTHDHADEYLRMLAESDYSIAHKSNVLKAVQMLFKWRHHELDDEEWDPPFRFSSPNQTTQPRDFLTRKERKQIREAALEYGSIPSYSNATPAERDRWAAHLAQRFDKPKSEIDAQDWQRANGWKIPSLVCTSLDAGLRPIEVSTATVEWVDIENNVLRIPREESAKNHGNWTVSLRDRTAEMLTRWLDERELYDRYEDSAALWLTREGNGYDSAALIYLLERLCEIADIPTENRKMSWYAIRHSTGTYMTREEDIAAAQIQLRHKSPQTTMKYDQAPAEDRRDALDRI